MTKDNRRQAVIHGMAQKLEALQRAGVTHLAKPGRRTPRLPDNGDNLSTAAVSPDAGASAATVPTAVLAAGAPLPAASVVCSPQAGTFAPTTLFGLETRAGDSLEAICQEVAACQRCAVLAQARTQTVFGVGNPQARLCFLGEAPGADEDLKGEPFVGRSGQLLTKIIEACKLKRSDVYILNVLKCRPPGNRNPLPDEVENCRGFLDRQLALIKPEFLCCLGAVAAQTLLETTAPIGRLRGKLLDYHGIAVVCTYHPAYLLRNPAAKRDVWEDMKTLMRHMGVELG